ncbi:hypothetical protein KVV02_000921 [Mortierella alpina]|uniref:BHLH domain-containing protein n=1 Tax=Mortierella alpina TaxID=64518 RepID=A0A9P8D2C8_MORAP|nr:hypothetical protein KVV02_000921 [Mortierella alpina]
MGADPEMKTSTSDSHSHSADDDCSMEDTTSRRASPSMEPPSALPNGSGQAAYAPPQAPQEQQHSPPPSQQQQQQHGYSSGSGYHYVQPKDPRDPRYYHDHHPQQAHTARNGHGANAPQSLQHPAPSTPSPPLPSSTVDGLLGRTLPPIEPSHPLHSYMSSSRRGSLIESEYSSGADIHRRPSTSAPMESNGYYNNGSSSSNGSSGGTSHGHSPGPGPASATDGRHPYPTSSPSSTTSTSTSSESHYHSHAPNSPMQLRQAENALGRRESLPSIHSSAGPLGQLLAQEPQRRHSIAHSDPLGNGSPNGSLGPLKRKTSGTPLSQVHSPESLDHPAKRRDSIPDAAYPYPSRSSYSAPSSPPRRGSIAPSHGHLPVLNLQPAAEIKPSMMASHGPPAGMGIMDHPRHHFPLHQPRRPSLLSESSSRRSSVADAHHPPHHGHPYPPPQHAQHHHHQQHHHQHHHQLQQTQDYDHRMNMDMEKMHLSSNHYGPPPPHTGPETPGSIAPPPAAHTQGSHLYPGYPASPGYLAEGGLAGSKGETPYSRSPELRVSHKLAERKRRKEMKELFDELRDSLPVDRSLKTSKWEILSKAVDFIASMKVDQDELTKEVEALRQEVARLRQ